MTKEYKIKWNNGPHDYTWVNGVEKQPQTNVDMLKKKE